MPRAPYVYQREGNYYKVFKNVVGLPRLIGTIWRDPAIKKGKSRWKMNKKDMEGFLTRDAAAFHLENKKNG